jgi:hypothetical protein
MKHPDMLSEFSGEDGVNPAVYRFELQLGAVGRKLHSPCHMAIRSIAQPHTHYMAGAVPKDVTLSLRRYRETCCWTAAETLRRKSLKDEEMKCVCNVMRSSTRHIYRDSPRVGLSFARVLQKKSTQCSTTRFSKFTKTFYRNCLLSFCVVPKEAITFKPVHALTVFPGQSAT